MKDSGSSLSYQAGFGNEFSTEVLPGALPVGQNLPQHAPYGLYIEQISGTAFTVPREGNRRSFVYRLRPAVRHQPFVCSPSCNLTSEFVRPASPNQMRWSPLPIPERRTDFVDGLVTLAGNGDPLEHQGCAIHLYAINASMTDSFFCNADGELLIVPQLGKLRFMTEQGILDVEPGEIGVIPRGIRMQVHVLEGEARGYVCENHGQVFRLPDLGPIGANGLAHARDFQTPVAWYEDRAGDFTLIQKYGGNLWRATIDHSPFDVVAWHGNYAPYKYDLMRFNAIGSISYDHPDPSIFLALQSITDTAGVDAISFLVLPPRWLAMEHSFRPPYFHRNITSEFMGLIRGRHDAKGENFSPGVSSLHNCMAAHGPDKASYDAGLRSDTSVPQKLSDTLAFMIESRTPLLATRFALGSPLLHRDYHSHWLELQCNFKNEG